MAKPADLGQAQCIRMTEKALLVQLETESDARWIPKSQVHDDSEVYDDDKNASGKLVVTEWFANKEGLI